MSWGGGGGGGLCVTYCTALDTLCSYVKRVSPLLIIAVSKPVGLLIIVL